jgi:hypothetical protein
VLFDVSVKEDPMEWAYDEAEVEEALTKVSPDDFDSGVGRDMTAV